MKYFAIWYKTSTGIDGLLAHNTSDVIFSADNISQKIMMLYPAETGPVVIKNWRSMSRSEFATFFEITQDDLLDMEASALQERPRPVKDVIKSCLSDKRTWHWQRTQVKKLGFLMRNDRDAPVWNWVVVGAFLEGSGFGSKNAAIQHCQFLGFDPDGTTFVNPIEN
jgi:hypothetical protein